MGPAPSSQRIASSRFGKRHVPAAAALVVWCAAYHLGRATPAAVHPSRSTTASLCAALERRGLRVIGDTIHWVDEERAGLSEYFLGAPAVLIARRRGEPSDVYSVRARLSPEGGVLGLAEVTDLTQTSLVSESSLVGAGHRIAWLVSDGPEPSVELADLDGQPLPHEWPVVMRVQTWLANYQSTGRFGGIARRSLKLSAPADRARVMLDGRELVVDTGAYEVRWQHSASSPAVGSNRADATIHEPAIPGNLVTWTVDRMRATSWFGSERTQWLKAVAFAAMDRWMRFKSRMSPPESEMVVEEIGDVMTKASTIEALPEEIGWPPKALKPILRPPLDKEGVWVPAHPDVVTLRNRGAPYPFLLTFLRTDPERAYSQISITLWDPRQIGLHVVAGTQEPRSATGELGSGRIPRDEALIGRVVGAFNGAFQSIHGEFGMMERDAVILPPKPYAATVVELRNGTAGFGTWPNSADIPEAFLSLRQNMTPLVADGTYNPYRRHWWGGVPTGWSEESRTVRSGLCLTKEGFVAYFYGNHADPDQLGKAMLATRCTYGMHLDMNAGHTGFEFYRTARTDHSIAPREIDPMWEAAGVVPYMPRWQFFSRLMVRKMPLMNFPRYLFRSSRDFFYLTMRQLLPEAPLEPLVATHPSDGSWDLTAFAHLGWPPSAAETRLHLSEDDANAVARIVLVDPSTVDLVRRRSARPVLTVRRARSAGTRVLWFADRRVFVGDSLPPSAEVISYGDAREAVADAVSAAGITATGKLAIVELDGVARGHVSVEALERVLRHLGCNASIFFETDIGVVRGTVLESESIEMVSTVPLSTDARAAVVLERSAAFGAHRIFTDTPVLPPAEWAIPQRRKVPYTGRHGKLIPPPHLQSKP